MIRTLLARLAGMFTGRRAQARLDEEIETHVALQAAEYEREGMPPDEARNAARRAFGQPTQIREEYREQTRLPHADSLMQDLRYTLRQWRTHPGFAATAIVTLALGIGANTAIFQLLDVIVLRPLPVPHPEELVLLKGFVSGNEMGFSYPQVVEMSARQNVVEGIFGSSNVPMRDFQMNGASFPELPKAWFVTGNYFKVLGTEPQVGRLFIEADDRAASGPVAVVSDAFWRRELGARANAIGSTLAVNGMVLTVVGVTRPEFLGERVSVPIDLWIPMGLIGQITPGAGTRTSTGLQPMARLRPDITRERAQATLSALWSQLREYGLQLRGATDYRLELQPGSHGIDILQTQFSRPLWLLMGIVGLVALIACSNLANLLLARATARTHEMGVRLAIGAGRGRLIRQLFTESLSLAVAGGILGLVLAAAASRAIVDLAAGGDTWRLPMSLDWRIAGFTILVSFSAAVIFGLAPAFAATHIGLNTALQGSRRSHSGGRSRKIAARGFVIAQIALSLMLAAGAALLVRSFWNVAHQDFGYKVEGVLTAGLTMDRGTFSDLFNVDAQRAIYERVREIPGVQSAGVTAAGLMETGVSPGTGSIATEDRVVAEKYGVRTVGVTPGYIEAMGMPILRGRSITEDDRKEAPHVAVISETAARLMFGTTDPIGRTFNPGREYRADRAMQVVGVMRDVRYRTPREALGPLIFAPYTQFSINTSPTVVIRTQGEPSQFGETLRQAIREVAPGLKIYKMSTLRDTIQLHARRERLLAWLSGGFGVLALVLAAVGLYGVVAYSAEQRTAEMGIRLALGATPRQVRALLLREVLLLLLVGVTIGGAATLALSRSLESLLFEVTPQDPTTMVIAAVVLSTVALTAGFLPARRAARLDPMTALRQE